MGRVDSSVNKIRKILAFMDPQIVVTEFDVLLTVYHYVWQ
jgi:hypothetical protein